MYELTKKNLIKNILDENISKAIVEEWENIIFALIKEIINNTRTNSMILKDSLNINKFIKIKIIPYNDYSMCKVIPGLVMTNKIFSKNFFYGT